MEKICLVTLIKNLASSYLHIQGKQKVSLHFRIHKNEQFVYQNAV